jgi:hypothetical protein
MTLCLDAKITPITGVMNKPLLCLTLQHTFGYTPAPNNQGVSVEVSASGTVDGTIVVYSPRKKAIGGAFSPADKEREGLVFVTEAPDPQDVNRTHQELSGATNQPRHERAESPRDGIL